MQLRRDFLARYGPGAARVFFAPGRVNLIGEHVDYNGGVVLPVAIELGMYVAARRRADQNVRLGSTRFRETHELSLDRLRDARPARAWIDYPVGALRLIARDVELPCGLDLLFHGTVPSGSGLSSSAALLVATLYAASCMLGLELARERVAELAFLAESQFVGVQCGRMDQMAAALCPSGHALLIDLGRQHRQAIALPASAMSLLVFDSRTRHRLASGGYNQRVAESQSALRALRQIYGAVEHLGQLSVAQGIPGAQLAARGRGAPRRARGSPRWRGSGTVSTPCGASTCRPSAAC
ncbi:MAG: galactokinase family protein [Planctomycetota bacterium]